MSESRVRENRTHGSMRRREATNASRASTRRTAAEASRRPYAAAVRRDAIGALDNAASVENQLSRHAGQTAPSGDRRVRWRRMDALHSPLGWSTNGALRRRRTGEPGH
jgi:hypothetical protein